MVGVHTEQTAQRRLAEVILAASRGTGIALAGSGAIREHGLISRPTEDIDLFAPTEFLNNPDKYSEVISAIEESLEQEGYSVLSKRAMGPLRHYEVSDGSLVLKADISIDYRDEPATTLGIGEVLSLEDAVANKVCAAFSRSEPRDYLDLDSIRQNGPFSDDKLLELAASSDTGFSKALFADSISMAQKIDPRQIERYGVSAAELDAIKGRYRSWYAELTSALDRHEAHAGFERPVPSDAQGGPEPNPAHTVASVAERARERASRQKAQVARNGQRDLGQPPARRQRRR